MRPAGVWRRPGKPHAVGESETEHPGEHLIGAGSVKAVDYYDFRRLRLADAAIAAQAQHMLGVAVTRTVARNRLHGKERVPSFAAQALHYVDGGDIDVTLGTAVMGFAGENRRDVPRRDGAS